MFKIDITFDAMVDMRSLRAHDRSRIFAGIERQLSYEPDMESRNRKRLRPNELADWELRIDPFRVFYSIDADEQIVMVLAVGRKDGNRLWLRGEEYEL